MTLPSPVTLITTALAVLAFVVAFYVLLARERKIPYITNFIFPPVGILFLSVFFAFAAVLVQPTAVTNSGPTSRPAVVQPSGSGATLPAPALASRPVAIASTVLTSIALLCLLAGISSTEVNILRLYNRQVNFRDDNWWKSTSLVRWNKRRRRKLHSGPTYEHSPIDVDPAEVVQALNAANILSGQQDKPADLRTIAICKESLRVTDPKIAKLCLELINAGWFVQYTTCIRHPFELIRALKTAFANNWPHLPPRIVLLNAHTPSFGFTDSIHDVKTLEVTRDGVRNVPAKDSFAGMHTANAKAFNIIKEMVAADREPRKPAILLYEGANALGDLESVEQYRIFARHVLSSERMWGGMLTVFVEPALGSTEMDLLRTYSDLFFAPTEVKSG